MSSLKCWLNKIEKQDKISKEDLNEILNRLDGHDKAVRADEKAKTIDECITYLLDYFGFAEADKASRDEISCDSWMNYEIREGIEELAELKEGEQNV